ncbi:MAG: EamA family transporter [Deltaproteobacteria bacterium]|nr:EamA family transporter [Deltaproteobacteria bacterium]
MSITQMLRAQGLDRVQGRVLVVVAGILWSLAGVFIKLLALHPLTIVFYRSLFAALFFSLFIRRQRWTLSLPLFASMASYTAAISSFVWANKLTTAANAIILQYTAPIFVFVFVRLLFREPIKRLDLTTLLFGMIGLAIIFSGNRGGADAEGVMVALLSGFLFSLYMVNLRFLRRLSPAFLTFMNNLACSLILLAVVKSLHLSWREAVALLIMGVVQLGIPYFLFSKGLETIPVQEASLIVLIEPVLNPAWVALAVGEIPSQATFVGGGFIVGSLAVRYLWLALHRPIPPKAPRGPSY